MICNAVTPCITHNFFLLTHQSANTGPSIACACSSVSQSNSREKDWALLAPVFEAVKVQSLGVLYGRLWVCTPCVHKLFRYDLTWCQDCKHLPRWTHWYQSTDSRRVAQCCRLQSVIWVCLDAWGAALGKHWLASWPLHPRFICNKIGKVQCQGWQPSNLTDDPGWANFDTSVVYGWVSLFVCSLGAPLLWHTSPYESLLEVVWNWLKQRCPLRLGLLIIDRKSRSIKKVLVQLVRETKTM